MYVYIHTVPSIVYWSIFTNINKYCPDVDSCLTKTHPFEKGMSKKRKSCWTSKWSLGIPILSIHINNGMNINIHIDINMNIDIPPPTPTPCRGCSQTGPGGGGMGWVHIIMNMNIEDYIIWYLLSIFYSLLVILYYLFPITSCLSQAEAGTWLNNCGFLYDLWAFRPFRTVRNDPSRQACK